MRDIRMKQPTMEYRMFKLRPIVEIHIIDEISNRLEQVEDKIFRISGLHPNYTTQKSLDTSLISDRLDKKSTLTLAMLFSLRTELILLKQHVGEWQKAMDPIFLVEEDTIKSIKIELPDEFTKHITDKGFFKTLTDCYTISGRHFKPIPYNENEYKIICYIYLPSVDSIIEEAATAVEKMKDS